MTTQNRKDNEVYILGSEQNGNGGKKNRKVWGIALALLVVILTGIILFFVNREETPEYYFEPEDKSAQSVSITTPDTMESMEDKAYIDLSEESINDVPLRIYTPRNAAMSLMMGMPDPTDSTIVFAAMAADIRKDNQQIVGDFVLSGERRARGVAKKGFAAIEENKVTIGVGESTPLLQQMIEHKGSFFRQYPLVHRGELMENKPKNKSIRRALAVRGEQIIMVETQNRESFHDFSQALIDIGVSDAIYLVGGDAFGWFRDKEAVLQEFGKQLPHIPENISYIIWR